MKQFLSIWFALNLALGPIAGAFAAPMMYMVGSETEEHCMGHASAGDQADDMQMDCCDSEHDQGQCCDHCVGHISGLLNTGFSLIRNNIKDQSIAFIQPVLSATHSPPYKPPQA